LRFSDRASNWIAGLGLGGFVAIFLGWLPIFGAAIVVAFAVPALRSRAPRAALGGLFISAPATWLLLTSLAAFQCAQFDDAPGQECAGADLIGWDVVAAVALAIGVGLTALEVRRR
jgi:hypothetical protein